MRQLTISRERTSLVAFADERAEEERARLAQATRDIDRLKAAVAARAFEEIVSYGRQPRHVWRERLVSLWGWVAISVVLGTALWLWLATYAAH